MSDAPESFHRPETLAMVGRYATPLAVGLVATGLFFAPLPPLARKVGAGLLLFSLVLNFSFVPLVSRLQPDARGLLSKARATLNLWVNVLLVLILGRDWPPIWLLLMLSAFGAAIYGSRERTLVTAAFLSLILVVINVLHRQFLPLDWGHVAAKSAFIFLTSLMINDLARAAREG